jgi:DNA-binding protein YbaB
MADREALLAELSALSATATSPEGAVSLSVNTDGVLTRLRLSDEVTRMSAAEISDLVMATYVKAQRESAERTAQLMLPMGIAGYLMERLKWRAKFEPNPQKAAEPAPAPSPSPRGGAVLQDRSETSAPEPAPSGPVSDDEWYGQGVRYGQAW